MIDDRFNRTMSATTRARMSEAAKIRWAKARDGKVQAANRLPLRTVRDWYGARGIMVARARDGRGPGGWSDWAAYMVSDHTMIIEAATARELVLLIRDKWGVDGTERFNITQENNNETHDPFKGLDL